MASPGGPACLFLRKMEGFWSSSFGPPFLKGVRACDLLRESQGHQNKTSAFMYAMGSLSTSPRVVCPGHSRPVASIEFSNPTSDGIFLLSGCHDKTAMLRSAETGDWIGTFEGHKGAVWGAAINAPATRVATCSGDFSAKVWDAISGDELCEFKHRHIVRGCDWSPDSAQLVTGGKEAKLRIFDISRPDAEPNILLGHDAGKAIKVVRFLQTGVFLSAGDDKTIRFWSSPTYHQSFAADLYHASPLIPHPGMRAL